MSHVDTTEADQSHVLKNSNDEIVQQSICQNTGSHKTKQTGEVLEKTLGEFKENKQIRYCKNHGLVSGKHRNEAKLIETDDKYDLELRFCIKHRTKISEAKHVNTFKNWDKQVSDKYGFIPLDDVILLVVDKDSASIDDVVRLHKNVSSCKTYNFLGAQIRI